MQGSHTAKRGDVGEGMLTLRAHATRFAGRISGLHPGGLRAKLNNEPERKKRIIAVFPLSGKLLRLDSAPGCQPWGFFIVSYEDLKFKYFAISIFGLSLGILTRYFY